MTTASNHPERDVKVPQPSPTQPNNDGIIRLILLLCIFLFVGILILSNSFEFAIRFWKDRIGLAGAVVMCVLVLYFPLSYIAYSQSGSDQRTEKLQEDFNYLGYARENAKRLYDKAYNPYKYMSFLMLAMGATLFGAAFLFLNKDDFGLPIDEITLRAIKYGFLGAYLFSAYLIYRRYTTNDLHPAVYFYCAFTIIAGIAFNYVAVEALTRVANLAQNANVIGTEAGVLAILAFSLGYFPYLAVRWFNRLAYKVFSIGQRRTELMDLGQINGISEWHETRLRENGIDDIQNLAAADIREVLVNSSFSAQQLVAWVDQAILYQYLDESEMDSFRRAKILVASDLIRKWDAASQTQREDLVKTLQSSTEILGTLICSISEGPNIHRVLAYWKRTQSETQNSHGIQSDLDSAMNLLRQSGEIPNKGVAIKLVEDIKDTLERTDIDLVKKVDQTIEVLKTDSPSDFMQQAALVKLKEVRKGLNVSLN